MFTSKALGFPQGFDLNPSMLCTEEFNVKCAPFATIWSLM